MIISVCMGVYNGEKYIENQIESIISELKKEDELIIFDDNSSDSSFEKLIYMSNKYPQIKLFRNTKNKGVIKVFELAIQKSKGDIVILSDQDDIWLPGRVSAIIPHFQSAQEPKLVVVDAYIFKDEKVEVQTFYELRRSRSGLLKNLWVNSYIGCCMAFSRGLAEKAIPFPIGIPMHDQWIGLLGDLYSHPVFIDERYVLYRRHNNNVTNMTRGGLITMIKKRSILVFYLARLTKSSLLSSVGRLMFNMGQK